ncbi:hypothetical protein ACQCVP_04830 [Rossellomorea vietnamensis]
MGKYQLHGSLSFNYHLQSSNVFTAESLELTPVTRLKGNLCFLKVFRGGKPFFIELLNMIYLEKEVKIDGTSKV